MGGKVKKINICPKAKDNLQTDSDYHCRYFCTERKKCTGAAMLPVRRDRGKSVTLVMPPACSRRSQSRWGLRCLQPASRSSADRFSISLLSIHPQTDYSRIARAHAPTLSASVSSRLFPPSLPGKL